MLSSLLPLLAAAAQAPSAIAGVPTPAVAAAHVEDCVAAAKAGGVDAALLQERGWRPATVTVNKGKKAPFELFFKPGDMTFLTGWRGGPEAGSCMLLIPTPTAAEADALRAALGRTAAQGAAAQAPDSWTTSTHRLSLSTMGNAQAQGLKVTVSPLEKR